MTGPEPGSRLDEGIAPPLTPLGSEVGVPPGLAESSVQPPSALPAGRPGGPAAPPPALVSTGRLVASAFELLGGSQAEMRRASFYIGAVVLGTVGPLALAAWSAFVLTFDDPFVPVDAPAADPGGAMLAILGILAGLGFGVAAVESRVLAVTVLGGAVAGRRITTRQALARTRASFWRAVGASIIVALPLAVVQAIVDQITRPILLSAPEVSVLTSTVVTAVVGAPLAYTLAGVVLGDVDPWEALRRSIRVYRVRRLAAVLVVLFETVAALLVLLGISAGADLLIRVVAALGLGPESGALGQALVVVAIVAIVFAFGTLLFTVQALTVAPQVVMFLGLTHASFGLDRVLPGGRDDPDLRRAGQPPFRWFTRPMLLAFLVGGLALALAVSSYA